MTSRHDITTTGARGSATTIHGEVIAPALAPLSGSGVGAGARALAWVALALAGVGGGCGDDARPLVPSVIAPVAARAAADPARDVTTELDGSAPAYGEAVIAELTGDPLAARAGFERVLGAPDAPPGLAARAALHLARMESRSGRSRHALDLTARAAALAPSDVVIAEGVAQLRAEAVAATSAGTIRGPRLGTPLPGVPADVATAYAEAEAALAKVHRLRPRPVIEALSSSIRAKEDATEAVVARYRALAMHGGLALVAGHYRAGSLYHDLALGLLFELPPELDPNVAAVLRRTLRGRAVAYLHKAVAEYEASLAGAAQPDAELWRLAAEIDLRGARDVLGEAGGRR